MNEEKEIKKPTKKRTPTKKTAGTKKKTSNSSAKKTTATKKAPTKKSPSKSSKSSSTKKTTTSKTTVKKTSSKKPTAKTTTSKTTSKKSRTPKKETPKAATEEKIEVTKIVEEVKEEKNISPVKEEIEEPEFLTDVFTMPPKEEMADDFLKEFRPNYVKLVICSILISLLIILVIIWGWDLIQISIGNEPDLCLSKTIYEYDDGKVIECKGLGYNVYEYDREDNEKFIFRPFFLKPDLDEK